MQDRMGICQWFHYMDFDRALASWVLLRELGVRHLRTDLSWADFHRPEGREWYSWLFDALNEFELLVCLWHTPPSLSMNGKSNGPPKAPKQFSELVWETSQLFGHRFDAVELWNEPNNRLKWDTACDPDWSHFATMIGHAASTAAQQDKRSVLGGMSPINGGWLDSLRNHDPNLLGKIDAVGLHAFPGQWNEPDHLWGGWPAVFEHLRSHTNGHEIWLTEVGYSTPTEQHEARQVEVLLELAEHAGAADRIYWYSLLDLPDSYDELEYTVGGYREPLEHCLGLVTSDGRRKPGFFVFKDLLSG